MILKLITDRTASDVAYAKSFQGKRWADLTTEQKAEYLLGLKGAYSYIDLNRVENAVKYLSDVLRIYGYPNTVNVKTNWTTSTRPYVSEIQRYIDNIAELKNKYYSSVEGTMPTTSTWLTMDGANYIEKVLTNIDELLNNMSQYFIYCGVTNCGQNKVWQQRFRRAHDWNSMFYDISKYDQEWNTLAVSNETVGHLEVDGRTDISSTINAWNNYIEDLDKKAGVIE